MFIGSYVVFVMLMFENGDIDYKFLEKFVKFYVEQGIYGIVLVGIIGELVMLFFDEYINVVKEIVVMVLGVILVIVGSGVNFMVEVIFFIE